MDNRRLILVLIFGFSILMLWEGWQRQHAPKPVPAVTDSAIPAAPVATTAKSSAVPTPSASLPGAPNSSTSTSQAKFVRVKTDLFKADISSEGGDIVRLELLKHRAAEDKKENLILFDQTHRYAAQSGLIGQGMPNHKSVWQMGSADVELKEGQNEIVLSMTASAGENSKATRTYTFKRGSYLVDVALEVSNGGANAVSPHAYFQLMRDEKSPEGSSAMMSTFTGPAIYSDAEKYQKLEFADIEKGKAKHVTKSDSGWVGMVQHYFVSAWLPAGKVEREFYTRKLDAGLVAAGVVVPMPAAEPGKSSAITAQLYAGPQEQDKLASIAPGLNLVVDYGWLTLIAAPLFWVLEWIFKFTGNWGWSIILLTVLIKMVFYPLSAASYKSMAKMRVLTPKLLKLKETYGDDRNRMNQEMMELYKREKVNPFGGCLPILVQIPVFISLYWVLLGTVEMRGAPWILWINDLSATETLFGTIPLINMPIGLLPIIMVGTMLLQTKLNPTPPDPIQAKIMMIMPFMFGFMFFYFPSGLVLYWTVNNILSIAQQWRINQVIEAGNK
jgi:YidC/Oxa1 family membrane protein insertase